MDRHGWQYARALASVATGQGLTDMSATTSPSAARRSCWAFSPGWPPPRCAGRTHLGRIADKTAKRRSLVLLARGFRPCARCVSRLLRSRGLSSPVTAVVRSGRCRAGTDAACHRRDRRAGLAGAVRCIDRYQGWGWAGGLVLGLVRTALLSGPLGELPPSSRCCGCVRLPSACRRFSQRSGFRPTPRKSTVRGPAGWHGLSPGRADCRSGAQRSRSVRADVGLRAPPPARSRPGSPGRQSTFGRVFFVGFGVFGDR